MRPESAAGDRLRFQSKCAQGSRLGRAIGWLSKFDERGLLHVSLVHNDMPPLRGLLADVAKGKRLDCSEIDDAIQQRMRRVAGAAGVENKWNHEGAA